MNYYWVTALFRQGYDTPISLRRAAAAIEWLPYLGRVTTRLLGEPFLSLNWVTALFRQGYDYSSSNVKEIFFHWVTALFRQGYDLVLVCSILGCFIEWLPYLGRVTTWYCLLGEIIRYWVTALFRQGYDSFYSTIDNNSRLSDCLI